MLGIYRQQQDYTALLRAGQIKRVRKCAWNLKNMCKIGYNFSCQISKPVGFRGFALAVSKSYRSATATEQFSSFETMKPWNEFLL